MPPKRGRGDGDITKFGKAANTSTRSAPKALTVKTRKRNYKAGLKLTKPFREVLDSYLDRTKQDRWITQPYAYQGLQGMPHLQATGQPSGLFPIVPKIFQVGSAAGPGATVQDDISSRTGSVIKLKSMTVNINLLLAGGYSPTQAAESAVRYKVMILSCKKFVDYTTGLVPNYFDTGSSQNLQEALLKNGSRPVAWDQYMQNFDLPVNNDLFTVHAVRTGWMRRGIAVGDASGSCAHMPCPLATLKIPLKVKSKVLKYDDPAHTLPSNWQPFLWIGYKAFDGTNLHSGNNLHAVGQSAISWENL